MQDRGKTQVQFIYILKIVRNKNKISTEQNKQPTRAHLRRMKDCESILASFSARDLAVGR